MSLNAIQEFVVHVESFRNIDLSHHGLYNLRFTLYHEINDQVQIFKNKFSLKQRIYAQPYHLKEGIRVEDKKTKNNNIHLNNPSQILDIHSAYCTRTFLVRFCDEKVDLNELCHFRTEFDAYPDYHNQEFFLEAELMFCDLSYIYSMRVIILFY